MEQPFGLSPLEEEMPEQGMTPRKAHKDQSSSGALLQTHP